MVYRLQRFQRDDYDLLTRRRFLPRQHLGQRVTHRGREDASSVDHAACQCREFRLGCRCGADGQQQGRDDNGEDRTEVPSAR